MAGAPRTRSTRIASQSASRSVTRRITSSPGSLVWSMISMAPSRQRTASTGTAHLRFASVGQELQEKPHREPHDVVVTAADLLHQHGSQTLDGVRTRLVGR